VATTKFSDLKALREATAWTGTNGWRSHGPKLLSVKMKFALLRKERCGTTLHMQPLFFR
jgi:hypothetical protein